MPQVFIEAPTGIGPDAKQTMMRAVTDALDEAFRMPDVRIWLREYAAENVAQDGRVAAGQVRPVVFLEVPELRDLDGKRKLVARISAALHAGYQGLANTAETLILINHYPLENAGWAGRVQADDPEAVAHIQQLNA